MVDVRSSLIHFACNGLALPRLVTPFARGVTGPRGADEMQAKWIELDLS